MSSSEGWGVKVPSPGSREARELGCSCAVMDNHYGEGFVWEGKRSFWVSDDCPLHGEESPDVG